MEDHFLKSLGEWVEANPGVLPKHLCDSVPSSSGAVASPGLSPSPEEPTILLVLHLQSHSRGPIASASDTVHAVEKIATPELSIKPTAETLYTPEMYFSKTNNPARRKFRHILRVGAMEAKALGVLTFSKLSIKQKHWIHKRVTDECPELIGYERCIDDVLITKLIQAIEYQKRKTKKLQVESKEKSGGHGKKEKPVKPKKSGKKSDKKQPKIGRGRIEHTSLKRQTAKKMKKGDKRTPKRKEEPTCEYERFRQRNITARKIILKAMEADVGAKEGIKAGDVVIAFHEGVDLARAHFVKHNDEIYAEIILCDHINSVEDVYLPHPVEDRDSDTMIQKLKFNELEKNDKFLWKGEKIRKEDGATTGGAGNEQSDLSSGVSPAPVSKRSLRNTRDPPKRLTSLGTVN